MIAAVGSDSAYFEGLQNYIVGGGRPTAVPSFDTSARQLVGVPTAAMPTPSGKIPTSSARPGKMTNQRITYARLVTKIPTDGAPGAQINPRDVQEGDIVFVHRYDGMYSGHDVNKPTRVATIAQLNAALRDYNYPAAALPANLATRPRDADGGYIVMPALDADGNANDPKGIVDEPEEPAQAPAPPPTPQQLADYRAEKHLFDNDYPKYRWRKCPFLAQWTPDGVCCGTEHTHMEDPMTGGAASNPGELLNIAVGGPTLVRNAANHKFNMHQAEHHIDDGLRLLDKVFVGLVCYEQRDVNDTLTHYMYQYVPFTSRQLAWASWWRGLTPPGRMEIFDANGQSFNPPRFHPEAAGDAIVVGGVNSVGPSVYDFARMVQVWRVGSVLDTRGGMLPYKCAMVNVVVEEWSLERVAFEYNQLFAEVALMQVVAEVDRAALIAAVQVLLPDEAATAAWETLATEYVVLGFDLPHMLAEIAAYKRIDAAWSDDDELARLNAVSRRQQHGQPAPLANVREPIIAVPRPRAHDAITGQPLEPAVPGQHQDNLQANMADPPPPARTVEGLYLYERPSADLARFNNAAGVLPPGMPSLTNFAGAAGFQVQCDPNIVAQRDNRRRVARVAALHEVVNSRVFTALERDTIKRAWRAHVAYSTVRGAFNLHFKLHRAGARPPGSLPANWPV